MFLNLTFAQGLVIGLLIGFFGGGLLLHLIHKKKAKAVDTFAWVISITWFVWQVSAGLTQTIDAPPAMFDLVSGGAVGFIFGETFFDYLANAVSKVFSKK
jgi:F0F1-type ATP synthase assembly protein I